MTKIIFIICAFTYYGSSAQSLQIELIDKDSSSHKSSVFVLKIFNNQSQPIGIITSINFSKFSEEDTLQIEIGDWYNGNGKDYFYTIEKSVNESNISEELPYYQILVVNPQTYFITNIEFSDFEKYFEKNINFSLMYISKVSCFDISSLKDDEGRRVPIVKSKEYLRGKLNEVTIFVHEGAKE